MIQFALTIASGNAALVDEPRTEVARMLREAADQIENDHRVANVLRDVNGGVVGSYSYAGEAGR